MKAFRGRLWAALVVAGLAGFVARAAVASYTPTVAVGQAVYAGGDVVTVTGAGFAPADVVTLQVTHAGGASEPGMGHDAFTVTADDTGAFEATWTLSASDPGMDELEAHATGTTAGEATAVRFTRGPVAETDASAYRAGETVTVSGRGFGAGEAVTLQVTHAGGRTETGMGHEATDLVADAQGRVQANWTIAAADVAGGAFVATLRGHDSDRTAGAAFSRGAEVGTDKGDYQPGETAVITGGGFAPNEPVTLQVTHIGLANDNNGHAPFTVSADAAGAIAADWYVDPDDSLGSKFLLRATGTSSGAEGATSFWDAGTITLTALDSAYTQTFDTLANTGTSSTVPTGWDFLESGTNANTSYNTGTGSSNAGDTYSFGAAGSTDRAFGGLLSGSLNPTVGVWFTNNTGGIITSLDVSYRGEQWRLGALARADRLDFQYSTTATALNTGTWSDVDALDFLAPVQAGTVGALNGNTNGTTLTSTITGLSIAPGATFWLRWTDFNATGADDVLAVDTFSLTPHGIAADAAPTVSGSAPAAGAMDVALDQTLSVTFSEPVTVTGSAFAVSCAVSGTHALAVSGGQTAFLLDPSTNFVAGEHCTLTVSGSQVSDVDANDPPDTMAADYIAEFDTFVDRCTLPFTTIPSIQGTGASAALTGVRTTRGVVVGDFEYPGSGGTSSYLRGLYIQDPVGDGNPATSDAIFVFNGNANTVNLGDEVVVTGTVAEFQDQTQLSSVTAITTCSSGASVTATPVTLPAPDAGYFERYEGMLVQMPQTLYVTEHFQLGRFGQVVLSSSDRLAQPTNVAAPGAPALAMQAANDLNRIILDDDLQSQNPDPIRFGRGGLPLSASNTLRGGDTLTGALGVMSYGWGGNAASGNAFRLRPFGALGGGAPDFVPANPRPTEAPAVGGRLRVSTMNLLNFFNTFSGCTFGVGGAAADCRGADSQAEFDRQWPKTVAAILGTQADVVGVVEMENDGYGASSAIAFLENQLNLATAPGTYAFIDVDARTGQVNALGTDAIKVGMLYKPSRVSLVGQTAVLNTTAFVNGGDGAPRNRPALAQALEEVGTGARFILTVNHLKSKGSACDLADTGDGQAACAAVRTAAATLLSQWLASDPTGTAEPDVLLMGDLNAYAKETPVATLEANGFTNLVSTFVGPTAYSYAFDGQWGYLDHALGSASLVGQVTGVAEWHINADEPSVLDYNTNFKSAGQVTSLYAADAYRISDHDPVVVGLDLNRAPSVVAGGPYQVVEGQTVTLTATGADPEEATLTYAWDLDNDGTFETVGQSVTFSAVGLQAPLARTVQVRVTDPGGLTATAPATVNVVWAFSGFRRPVDPAPVMNVVKAGSAVPVKFSLSGNQGLAIFAAGYPASVPMVCDATAVLDPVEEVTTAGQSGLTYDATTDSYSYVWKTEKAWTGCRRLIVRFTDGNQYTADFTFTK